MSNKKMTYIDIANHFLKWEEEVSVDTIQRRLIPNWKARGWVKSTKSLSNKTLIYVDKNNLEVNK